MSVFSRARYALARLLYKAGGLAIVPRWVDTTVLEPSWRALSRDGYSRNAAVFACVSTLSFDIPEPPLYCYTPSGELLMQGPLARLLRRPNPIMSQRELMTLVTAYAAIGGNAYIHIVRDRRGQPVQLWPYHAGQMIPVPAGGPQALTWIERYDYDDGTGVDVPVPAQDVIHLRWPSVDPQQPWQALPPLAAAAAEVDAGNEVVRYIRALLKNDATPRVVLSTPTGAFLSDSTVERMKDQWRERYGGDNRGGVAVLEEGVTMQRLSLDMAEMAFDALVRVPEVHIAAVFRIPAIIAGLGAGLDASTYSNYKEARQAYTQQTLMPLWMAWSEELHIALAEPLGMELRYDFSNISALREDQNARSERTVQQWTSGLITRNEARLALGYPEDEYGGEVYLMPTNAMLVPVGMMEIEGPAHEAQETPLIEQQEQEEPDDEDPDDTPDDSPDDEGEEEYDDDLPPEERNAPLAIETRMQPAREYVAPPIEDVATSAARRIRRYLSEQYRRAAEYVTQAEQMSIRAQKDLFAQLPLDFGDEIMEIMRQFYPLLLERAWDGAMNEIGMELRFDLENPKVQEVLHLLALEVRRVSDTTREEIRGIVGRMSSEGISYEQAALEIAQLAGINSQTRALTIAVTESARAFTQGSLLAWRESNEVEYIEWSAEPTACPICRAVNGTTVQLDRTFGGILPPAHPNCRCALLPVLRDA